MDADDPFQDAADHKISVPGGDVMGTGGCKDGEEGYGGQSEDGTGKIFERNLKFVRFVHIVRFLNVIV